jgi:2-keto-4-pentenoate hydratase
MTDRAAKLLIEHWRAGRVMADLPPELKPKTRAEGYAAQAAWERESTQPLFGWKIAATSIDGQRHIGVDGPLAGRLLAERVATDGATLPMAANRMRVAEAEFAFRMGRDLAPRGTPYTVDEVLAAVAALHIGIEVPDSRFEDFASVGGPALIADNACADRFVLGPEMPAAWRSMDLAAHAVRGLVAGKAPVEGRGANVLGDPRVALTWLANELSGLGITLKAGQVVTTGTCVKPLAIGEGDQVTMDFGALGSAKVSFARN